VQESPTTAPEVGGGVVAPRHALDPEFAPFADDPRVFTAHLDDAWVSFGLRGAAPVPVRRAQTEVRYPGVLPGADLVYDLTGGVVKETLVLAADPGADASSWQWDVNSDSLTPRPGDLGGVDFVDASGAVVLAIPRAAMWDSSGCIRATWTRPRG